MMPLQLVRKPPTTRSFNERLKITLDGNHTLKQKIGMLLDVCDQPFLVLAHPEEIIRLAELLDRPLTLGTEAADDIFLSPESFVECAIPTSI